MKEFLPHPRIRAVLGLSALCCLSGVIGCSPSASPPSAPPAAKPVVETKPAPVAKPAAEAKPAPVAAPAPAPAKPAPKDDAKHDHEHGDHEHPKTFAAGVTLLDKTLAAVKDHLAAAKKDAADDAVHDVAHLIEDMQGLLGKESLPAEAKAAATKALDEIFECCDKIDTALHAAEGSKAEPPADVHKAHADRIAKAVAALKAAAAPPQKTEPAPKTAPVEKSEPAPKATPTPAATGEIDATEAIIKAAKQREGGK